MRAIIADLVSEGTATITDGLGRAWRIQRIRSVNLAGQGLAELVGAVAADEAVVAAQREYRLATGADPAKLAEIEARAMEAQQQAAMRKLALDPRALDAVTDRVDRVVCAGVVGCGEADGEAGALSSAECEPVSLVFDASAEDLERGRVWVGRVSEAVRTVLYDAIEGLTGATKIRPFRGAAGAAAAAGPDREQVRHRPRKRA